MKIAVIGSRKLNIDNMEDYIPKECDEIVSGGAIGIDRCAARYAARNGIKLKEFIPDYARYRGGAPLVRNKLIVDYADEVIAFWDGTSHGTRHVIKYCVKINKKCTVYLVK